MTGSTKAWLGGFGEICPFGLVSDGKKMVANAITDKGVSTSETATFATMAENISAILQLDTSDATANAAQLLSGYTAYARGSKISGSMANRGAVTSTLNCGNSYTIPAGYHNGSGKVTANSLASQTPATATAAQILSGYTAWVNGSKLTGTAANYAYAVKTFSLGTREQLAITTKTIFGSSKTLELLVGLYTTNGSTWRCSSTYTRLHGYSEAYDISYWPYFGVQSDGTIILYTVNSSDYVLFAVGS